MLSPDQNQRLKSAAQSAVACERATDLPAELTVAQWALESNWGTHQPGNNCFGIKAYEGCYGVQLLQSTEVINGVRTPVIEKFATFPTLDACFAKHANLFTTGKPYAQAWAAYRLSHDLHTFICEIAHVYATDPNYANILLQILAMPEVKMALAAARATIPA
jgi:flagellum-specific peptidoglycan hydrolase FlgJ